jgi:hypothetical protein
MHGEGARPAPLGHAALPGGDGRRPLSAAGLCRARRARLPWRASTPSAQRVAGRASGDYTGLAPRPTLKKMAKSMTLV